MQNWILRHICKVCFSFFWAVSCAFGFNVCQNSYTITVQCSTPQKTFSSKYSIIWVPTKGEFYADFICVEKVAILFENFVAKRARSGLKTVKYCFVISVNQNKLYFPFPGSDHQVVKNRCTLKYSPWESTSNAHYVALFVNQLMQAGRLVPDVKEITFEANKRKCRH